MPVFLGDIDLRSINRMYYYGLDFDIVLLMFLSWAGESLAKLSAALGESHLAQELGRSVRALHRMGVAHTDVQIPNALWSGEKRRVMMIDFERAILRTPPRRALLQLSPSKKSRGLKRKSRPNVVTEFDHEVQNDIWAAKFMLRSY